MVTCTRLVAKTAPKTATKANVLGHACHFLHVRGRCDVPRKQQLQTCVIGARTWRFWRADMHFETPLATWAKIETYDAWWR